MIETDPVCVEKAASVVGGELCPSAHSLILSVLSSSLILIPIPILWLSLSDNTTNVSTLLPFSTLCRSRTQYFMIIEYSNWVGG